MTYKRFEELPVWQQAANRADACRKMPLGNLPPGHPPRKDAHERGLP